MTVPPIPPGFHTITPYLIVRGAVDLIEFVKQAFAATEVHRTTRPDGSIAHAQLRIGDSAIEIADGQGDWSAMPCALHLYVPDADAVYAKALAAGAISTMDPATRFYGDREAGVQDPCGNHWFIATHLEEVPPDELARRAAEFLQQEAE